MCVSISGNAGFLLVHLKGKWVVSFSLSYHISESFFLRFFVLLLLIFCFECICSSVSVL